MGNEESRQRFFPNGIEHYLAKPEDGESEDEGATQPSPSRPASEAREERVEVDESGDEPPHPDRQPGGAWPEQPCDANPSWRAVREPAKEHKDESKNEGEYAYDGGDELDQDSYHPHQDEDYHGSEECSEKDYEQAPHPHVSSYENYSGRGINEATAASIETDGEYWQLPAEERGDLVIAIRRSLFSLDDDDRRRAEQERRQEDQRRNREEAIRRQAEQAREDKEAEDYICEPEITDEDFDLYRSDDSYDQDKEDSGSVDGYDQDHEDSASDLSPMKPSGPDDGEPGQSDKQAGEDHSQTPNQLITGDETPHNADFHSGSPKRDQPHQLEPDATGSSETKPWTNIPRNNSEVDQSGTPDQPNGSGPSVQSQAVESFAETLVPPANGNTDNTQ